MRVAVVGGGIVGLACAVELDRAGHDVSVFDPTPGRGATEAAAGMISPAGEAWHGEEELLRLGLESAALWPEYARGLTSASGVDVDYRSSGTLLAGCDQDDVRVIERTVQLLAVHDVLVQPVGRREIRELEPTLTTRVVGGALLPEDHSVNPRRVAAAMLTLLGSRVVTETAHPAIHDGTCRGVVTGNGEQHDADVVVVATGSRLPESLPRNLRRLVRPVRGEVVRARAADAPGRTVRGRVHGEDVYVVPRGGGEVVIGATVEEHPGEPLPTVGGVWRLLHAARMLLPSLDQAAVLEVTARDRPGTPDNRPLLGPTDIAGLFLAAGHYRGGVLLAPVTARLLTTYVDGGTPPTKASAFTPDRLLTRTTT